MDMNKLLSFLARVLTHPASVASLWLGLAVLLLTNVFGYPSLRDWWQESHPEEAVAARNYRLASSDNHIYHTADSAYWLYTLPSHLDPYEPGQFLDQDGMDLMNARATYVILDRDLQLPGSGVLLEGRAAEEIEAQFSFLLVNTSRSTPIIVEGVEVEEVGYSRRAQASNLIVVEEAIPACSFAPPGPRVPTITFKTLLQGRPGQRLAVPKASGPYDGGEFLFFPKYGLDPGDAVNVLVQLRATVEGVYSFRIAAVGSSLRRGSEFERRSPDFNLSWTTLSKMDDEKPIKLLSTFDYDFCR